MIILHILIITNMHLISEKSVSLFITKDMILLSFAFTYTGYIYISFIDFNKIYFILLPLINQPIYYPIYSHLLHI